MSRVVKNPVERRAEIVDAARVLFQTKEYDKASMQDIMDLLQIAKGTIYHYFKSKEDLLEAVVQDMVEQLVNQLQDVVKKPVSALEKMKLLLTAGKIPKESSGIVDALHMPKNAFMHTRLLAVSLLKMAPVYADVIKQGCTEGVFTCEAPLESAEFIIAGVQFLTDVGCYPWTKEQLLRRIAHFPQLIEQQLKAPSGSFGFLLEMIEAGSE
ncbi:MAG: TetR/AcrR family transcriptional regulator [Verrucomicrobia bacterium]|nr:TetR/AcrR family transcriptional regulator [Verrucomicrobiota bacterium]